MFKFSTKYSKLYIFVMMLGVESPNLNQVFPRYVTPHNWDAYHWWYPRTFQVVHGRVNNISSKIVKIKRTLINQRQS